MKIVKIFVAIIAYILALLAIIVSLGSILCKYTDLPENSILQVFGYVSFFWVLLMSSISLVLFLILKKLRLALSYLFLTLVFVVLLHDFSLNFLSHKIPSDPKRCDSLTVMAYNVKYYSYGIEKIAGFINKSVPDVLLLSESLLTPEKLEYLKNSLPSYSVITDEGHDLSLLSRYPVMSYKVVELPTYLASFSSGNNINKLQESGIHRSFVHAVLNINGTLLNVLSLRLIAGRPKDKSLKESIVWGKYLLNAQHKELAVFVSYLEKLNGPVIFGGDLNVPPNSEIIHQLNHYVKDTYLDEHSFGSFTFKVSFPTMRLDYLFHSKDIVSKSSEVVRLNPALSDHFPLRAVFYISKRETQVLR